MNEKVLNFYTWHVILDGVELEKIGLVKTNVQGTTESREVNAGDVVAVLKSGENQ